MRLRFINCWRVDGIWSFALFVIWGSADFWGITILNFGLEWSRK